ncbi:MAG: type II toxin-antitoxin system PemK/MazF family toxin [Clostridia bacterium]|nr:type II toxin-antitoxin system PemK/MazF family toxin [Clostridia bacterium]
MKRVEQGDLLRVGGLGYPVMVVSNDFFNESGKAIVCPIVKSAVEGPLHIRVKDERVEGYVLCEQVRFVDLTVRRWSKLSETHYFDIMDISDAVMGMFDYQAL